MKPVFQRILEKDTGDCMAACIASILELDLDLVPNFRALAFEDNNSCNLKYTCPWLEERGLQYVRMPWRGALEPYWRDVYCICSVPSQCFEGSSHYVVGHITDFSKLKIVHDPKVSNKPYDSKDVKDIGLIILTGSKVVAHHSVALASYKNAWENKKRDYDELNEKLIKMGCLGPIAKYFIPIINKMTDEQKHEFVRHWNQN